MQVLLIALIILLLFYLLLKYKIKLNTLDNFTNFIYSNINEYLNDKKDGLISSNNLSRCYNNNSEIKRLTTLNCKEYNEAHNVNKTSNVCSSDESECYKYSELCPEIFRSPHLCMREYNNNVANKLLSLNNIILETDNKFNYSLNNINDSVNEYRYDKYRLYNNENIQDFLYHYS